MAGQPTTRRTFLGTAAGGAGAALTACAPVAPSPSADSAGPASGAQTWEQEWADLTAAAKREGHLVMVTAIGISYTQAVDAFMKAFPGIEVEHQQTEVTKFAPKAIQEAKSGIFAYDVSMSGHAPGAAVLYTQGRVDPVREQIFRPDVTDDASWHGGFERGFPDQDQKWCYSTCSVVMRSLWIDTNQVKPDEIKTIEDLLQPKWKGKIISGDPRSVGSGGSPGTALRAFYGDDIIKRLWKDQEVVLSVDLRQITESVVRGRYPVGIGVNDVLLQEFLAQGVGKNVMPIEIPHMNTINSSQSVIYVYKQRPNPNAARLFINWYLSKEGQTTWTSFTKNNSRRTDVPPMRPELQPDPSREYYNTETWKSLEEYANTYALAQKILT